jgi:hypothetical protein
MVDMFASSSRSPVAGVRSFRRAICSAPSSTPSAAVFSAKRHARHSLGTLITFTRGVHGDRHTGTVSLRVVLLGIGTFLNTSSRIRLNETVDCGRRLASTPS